MTRPILLVLALEQENHEQQLHKFADEILYTGVGKVNATYALTQKLLQMPVKPLVVNVGSAGSHSFDAGIVVCITEFIQRDMDARAMGFALGQTPFEANSSLEYGIPVNGLPLATCFTGDSFVTEAHPHFHLEVIDMEAYALAHVCQRLAVPFLCLKFITDGANGDAADDWQQAVKLSAIQLSTALTLALTQLHQTKV